MGTTSSQTDLTPESGVPDDIFVTTCWTMVLAATDRSTSQAERAMEEICQTYWFPLYAYIRRRGHSPENAEDLTQEFFRQLLEHHWIGDVDREKGRFRAFLITALKHFMAKEWRKASAKKRGGGQRVLSLDSSIAEGRYASAVTPSMEAEALFDRQWALTLLNLTIKQVKNEYADAGKADLFATLKDGLVIAHQSIDYPSLSAELDMTEGAIRVAVHRMRKRFRELYRNEVAQTLPPGADLDDEMHHLAESLVQA
jgi:DNA-directed RNA polymerase specialized sigma24 family protein